MAEILKGKYNRLANDKSQLQQFGDEVCSALDNGEGGMVKPFKPSLKLLATGILHNDTEMVNVISASFFNSKLDPNKFYIITFNNTFILTPISQSSADATRALFVCNLIINAAGESMMTRGRLLYDEVGEVAIIIIRLEGALGDIQPTAYLFELDLGL